MMLACLFQDMWNYARASLDQFAGQMTTNLEIAQTISMYSLFQYRRQSTFYGAVSSALVGPSN